MSDLHERLLAATGPRLPGVLLSAAIVNAPLAALRAVVELHAPDSEAVICAAESRRWPCSTIQAIARELGVDP